MGPLQSKLLETNDFLYGVELVSTRGSMSDTHAVAARDFANELIACDQLDWVSITDNAGGNPMLAPVALAKPILYAGKEVVIHLSCKDFNRNGLESEAWFLASEGFNNILVLTGDAPISGNEGVAKPVFDIDSIGLLTLLRKMNAGMALPKGRAKQSRRLNKTNFLLGAVTTNFKLHENEVLPQHLKLEKKIAQGAQFIINQVGYDSRKIHELKAYMDRKGIGNVPLIGNVFLLNRGVARVFNSMRIPGVVVSDALLETCQKQAGSPDKGKAFFLELAAKQIAVYRGLGYRGGYLGGVHKFADLERILAIEKTFGEDDWETFAHEIRYSRPGEFFFFAENPDTGLADPSRLEPSYEASLQRRQKTKNITLNYRVSKWAHGAIFVPEAAFGKFGTRLCKNAKDQKNGPKWLRTLEHLSKATLYNCMDCGDCSLPDIAYLCPESQCAKNQRNGPCGGTRDGKCEVHDFECIWARAYDRMKHDGRDQNLLDHVPVIQDQGLRGTSGWANNWLGRDHFGHKAPDKELTAKKKIEQKGEKTNGD